MLSISQMICLHEHQQKQPEQTSLGQSLDVVQWEGPVKRQVSVAEAEAGHRRGYVRQDKPCSCTGRKYRMSAQQLG